MTNPEAGYVSEKKPDWRPALGAVIDERRRNLGSHPGLDELVAYHAGELDAETSARLQDHLVLCPRCAEQLLELDAFTADAAIPPHEASAKVVPIARWRAGRPRRWVAAAAAVAAAVLLVFWPRGGTLPDYELTFGETMRPYRGEETPASDTPGAGDPVFAIGHRLDLKLLPATAVTGPPPTARAYLHRAGELHALSASTLEIDTLTGGVSMTGIVGRDLQLPSGENELVLTVARPDAVLSRRRLQSELAIAEQRRGRRWIGLHQKIQIIEPTQNPAADRPASDLPTDDDEGPWIEYAGCRTILIGPLCILPENRRLALWVEHPRTEDIRINGGSRWASYPSVTIQGGTRYEIELDPAAVELVVEVNRGDKRSVWVLEVGHGADPDWLVKARELYRDDGWDEARQLLAPRTADPDPVIAGPALSLLARIERLSGRAKIGDDLYRRAIDAHRGAGRLFDQVRDATGLTYHLIAEKRFAQARSLLDALPVDATSGSADARYLAAYFRGLVAEETGDHRAAMSWMKQAVREAEKAGSSRDRIYAVDLLARQLYTVGLTEAATELYSRVQEEMPTLCPGKGATSDLTPCDCARLHNSRAWTWLLSLEAGHSPRQIRPPSSKRQSRFSSGKRRRGETCAFPEDLPNVRLNLALAALHSRDTEKARSHLEEARVDSAELPRQTLWQLDVEARLALFDSRPEEALRLYGELAEHAGRSSAPEAAWRAAFGTATALESLGRSVEASRACDKADQLLEQESLLVPIHMGRERFLAQRELSSSFCLDLLIRQRRHEDALAVVRRSAARALRHLRISASIADLGEAERELWHPSCGLLPGDARRAGKAGGQDPSWAATR